MFCLEKLPSLRTLMLLHHILPEALGGISILNKLVNATEVKDRSFDCTNKASEKLLCCTTKSLKYTSGPDDDGITIFKLKMSRARVTTNKFTKNARPIEMFPHRVAIHALLTQTTTA
ncbi:hypothetical protein KEM48_008067 [Puccinia striiformis f. sp. tritici PST-130]|nr:hypothetical protein KEM48_008067 [Puccinia striiformis f. sp. tritici PST-130]